MIPHAEDWNVYRVTAPSVPLDSPEGLAVLAKARIDGDKVGLDARNGDVRWSALVPVELVRHYVREAAPILALPSWGPLAADAQRLGLCDMPGQLPSFGRATLLRDRLATVLLARARIAAGLGRLAPDPLWDEQVAAYAECLNDIAAALQARSLMLGDSDGSAR